MKLALTALVGAAAGLAAVASAIPQTAAAQPAPPAQREVCFRSTEMRNHTIVNDRTIYFQVFPNKVFELTASNNCFAGAFPTDPLIMTHIPPNSNLICGATDIDLKVAHVGAPVPTSCIVNSIRQLSPDEVAALPPKLKP